MEDWQKIEEHAEQLPVRCRGAYRRAQAGKGYRSAVHAKCNDCMAGQLNEVAKCDIVTCSLWLYRPTMSKSARLNALRRREKSKREQKGRFS